MLNFKQQHFFFKYNRNYALESHLLSYDSTCEKQLIIIYSFEDLEKNMIWWVVFSLRYIVKFGSRKIFGDNKFLISIVFKNDQKEIFWTQPDDWKVYFKYYAYSWIWILVDS